MTQRISIDISPVGSFVMFFGIGILGFFVYDHNITSAACVIAIAMVVGLVTLLSFIPVIGWIIASLLTCYWVIPTMLEITGLEHTWLITVIFAMGVFSGLITTVFMTLAVAVILRRR
jgi:hypothetical protein